MAFKYSKRTSARAKKTKGKSFVAKGQKPPLGQGGRFKALRSALAKKGARTPGALAGWIGRRKFGSKVMGRLSAAGRRSK